MNTNIDVNTNIKNNSQDNNNEVNNIELPELIYIQNTQNTQYPNDLHATPEPFDPTKIVDNNEEQQLIFNDIFPKSVFMIYDETKEMDEETQLFNYHKNKDCGYWKIAKMIIAHANKDKNNSEFFLDYLDVQLQTNNDNLENIEKVFYTNNLDSNIVYEFEGTIAKFIVENLKIFKYKPVGYVFNKDVNQNKWNFTISIITSKNIYTSNRYINENQIGYY